MHAHAREDLKSTEVFHVEHVMENPRDNTKNPGLNWVGLLMRSKDPIGKYGKKFEFSILVYMPALTLLIVINLNETADT